MGKKRYVTILAVCLACVGMRLMIPKAKPTENGQIDPSLKAKMASRLQGKLVVMRMFGTTTSYLEDRCLVKETARVGYVHDGSVDIIVDLMKAKFRYEEVGEEKFLHIVAPNPTLDRSTVGIEPSRLKRVTLIPRAPLRTQEVFTELEDKSKKLITEKQEKTFASVSVIEDAKAQARCVLVAFYQACVSDEINIDVAFESEERSPSVNQDIRIPVEVE